MKTAAASAELESLRAEVTRLQAEVEGLKSQIEADSEPEEVWNVWPYTWFAAAFEASQHWIHGSENKLDGLTLERHDKRPCSH